MSRRVPFAFAVAAAPSLWALGLTGCSSEPRQASHGSIDRAGDPTDAALEQREEGASEVDGGTDAAVHATKGDADGSDGAEIGEDAAPAGHKPDAEIAYTDAGGAETGSAGGPADAALADAGRGWVTGSVVHFDSRRRLANRTVWIAGASTTTDSNGSFTLAAPDRYDVTVVDPDHTAVSIYRGLSRRDVVLGHRPSRNGETPQKQCLVSGNLVGGGPFPLGSTSLMTVYLFSEVGRARQFLGGSSAAEASGPGFGPLRLAWSGADALPAKMVAFGLVRRDESAPATYWLGSQVVSVSSGSTASLELALTPTTSKSVVGTVELPAGALLRQAQAYYRLPVVSGIVQLDERLDPATPFEFRFADLSSIGATPCIAAVAEPGQMWTELCDNGFGPGAPILSVDPAPSLSRPAGNDTPLANQTLSWTAARSGIYVLRLSSEIPANGAPSVDVYTTATSELWPDLTAVGLPYPSAASYEATVGALGPYTTIDEATGPEGMSVWVPRETRQSYSTPISFSTPP